MHSLLISRVGGLEIDIGRRESFRDSLARRLSPSWTSFECGARCWRCSAETQCELINALSTLPFPFCVSVQLPTQLISVWSAPSVDVLNPSFFWRRLQTTRTPFRIRSYADRKWLSCCFVGVIFRSRRRLVSVKTFPKLKFGPKICFSSSNWVFNVSSEHFDGEEVDVAPKYSHNHNQFSSVLIVCSVDQEEKSLWSLPRLFNINI